MPADNPLTRGHQRVTDVISQRCQNVRNRTTGGIPRMRPMIGFPEGTVQVAASPAARSRAWHDLPKSIHWIDFAAHSAAANHGGACRDRTDDPLLAKQVLSQLS